MAARQATTGPASFRASLARTLGGGVALVAVVALAFWGLGQVAGPEPAPEVAGSPEDTETGDGAGDADEPDPEESDGAGDERGPGDAGDPGDGDEPDGADDGTEGAEDADDGAPGDGDADPDDAEDGQDADDDTDDTDDTGDADEGQESSGDDQAFDPGEISVQVLDGVGTDGGAAAAQVARELRDAGYRVVAENPALAYDQTAVLWTSGSEEQARQVAAEIDAAETREQPGNLSEQVDVHVVVGADRA